MSTSDSNCKDSASNDVCELEEKLQNMNTADESNSNNDVSVCANCGKEGTNEEIKNLCNKCKVTTYCNAVCKKVHKKKHKKDCEEHVRRAAEKHNEELKRAAELHDIELFKQPPPVEDCPICFLRIPTLHTGSRYQSCCGKTICSGCIHAPLYDHQGNEVDNKKCPFCRTPHPKTDEEIMEREKKRVEAGDPIAIYNQGNHYQDGTYGYPQDLTKALEYWHRAGELGYAEAYSCIGYAYQHGEGVEVDKKKARHYYELSAMGGNEVARNNLGFMEIEAGNFDRGLKHWIISVRGGYINSLSNVKVLYSKGHASKDDYTKALQLYQVYLGDIKSVQRDKAAVADDEDCRYY